MSVSCGVFESLASLHPRRRPRLLALPGAVSRDGARKDRRDLPGADVCWKLDRELAQSAKTRRRAHSTGRRKAAIPSQVICASVAANNYWAQTLENAERGRRPYLRQGKSITAPSGSFTVPPICIALTNSLSVSEKI